MWRYETVCHTGTSHADVKPYRHFSRRKIHTSMPRSVLVWWQWPKCRLYRFAISWIHSISFNPTISQPSQYQLSEIKEGDLKFQMIWHIISHVFCSLRSQLQSTSQAINEEILQNWIFKREGLVCLYFDIQTPKKLYRLIKATHLESSFGASKRLKHTYEHLWFQKFSGEKPPDPRLRGGKGKMARASRSPESSPPLEINR